MNSIQRFTETATEGIMTLGISLSTYIFLHGILQVHFYASGIKGLRNDCQTPYQRWGDQVYGMPLHADAGRCCQC